MYADNYDPKENQKHKLFFYLIFFSLIVNLKKKGFCRLMHWGPITALTIICSITTTAIYLHYQLWPPTTWLSFLDMTILILWMNMILYHFYRASTLGPGFVPRGWTPNDEEDVIFVQHCFECASYKCPRSHHCRKCQRCVLKMDHHCPWINTCVGHKNHHHFVIFLFVVVPACIHALVVMTPCLYYALNMHYYIARGIEPIIFLPIPLFVLCFLSTGMALGVILAVGALFVLQFRSILSNETGIESWIKDKANYRKERGDRESAYVHPYHLGRWRNLKEVFWSRGDGVWWNVRDKCHQYTLTVEQLQQKNNKRSQSVMCAVMKPYRGSWLPVCFGCATYCDIPCIDEKRLKVAVRDRVVVSRYRKHWFYGEKLIVQEGGDYAYKEENEKGWFPRKCGKLLDDALPLPLYKLPPRHLAIDIDILHEIADRKFLGTSKKEI